MCSGASRSGFRAVGSTLAFRDERWIICSTDYIGPRQPNRLITGRWQPIYRDRYLHSEPFLNLPSDWFRFRSRRVHQGFSWRKKYGRTDLENAIQVLMAS